MTDNKINGDTELLDNWLDKTDYTDLQIKGIPQPENAIQYIQLWSDVMDGSYNLISNKQANITDYPALGYDNREDRPIFNLMNNEEEEKVFVAYSKYLRQIDHSYFAYSKKKAGWVRLNRYKHRIELPEYDTININNFKNSNNYQFIKKMSSKKHFPDNAGVIVNLDKNDNLTYILDHDKDDVLWDSFCKHPQDCAGGLDWWHPTKGYFLLCDYYRWDVDEIINKCIDLEKATGNIHPDYTTFAMMATGQESEYLSKMRLFQLSDLIIEDLAPKMKELPVFKKRKIINALAYHAGLAYKQGGMSAFEKELDFTKNYFTDFNNTEIELFEMLATSN